MTRLDYKKMLTGDLIQELEYLNSILKNPPREDDEFIEYRLASLREERDAVSKELTWRRTQRTAPTVSRRSISREDIERIKRENGMDKALSICGIAPGKGKRYYVKCPLHEEKTASMLVEEDKGLFYCFSCNKGGDAVRLIMLKMNASFIEAVKVLGGTNGIVANPVAQRGSRSDR